MAGVDDLNRMIANVFPVVGNLIDELGNFPDEMILIERLAGGLVALTCSKYNKDPEQAKDSFFTGFKQAVDDAIYGKKQ